MARARANQIGWASGTTILRARHVALFDAHQVASLDGDSGGTYTPTTPLRIEGAGFGSDALNDTTITGTLQRAVTGRWQRRVDTTTIQDVPGSQLLDMSYDVYRTEIDHANDIVLVLAVTSGNTPGTGDEIEVIRQGIPNVPHAFQIWAEDDLVTRIGVFIQAPPAGNQLNQVYSARYFFNGTTWVPLRFSADVGQ